MLDELVDGGADAVVAEEREGFGVFRLEFIGAFVFVVVDIDALEDELVEGPADVFGGLAVAVRDVLAEGERHRDEVVGFGDVGDVSGEFSGDDL
ncbi:MULTISPECIES: hypothetical protein [unclassified Leucobacter]|uniref:hypothetical protein n=1 Tax=unclassified Leucobacter TaxID=2621730 RepID=UPI003018D523